MGHQHGEEKHRKLSALQTTKKHRVSRMARLDRLLRPAVSQNSKTSSHSTDTIKAFTARQIRR